MGEELKNLVIEKKKLLKQDNKTFFDKYRLRKINKLITKKIKSMAQKLSQTTYNSAIETFTKIVESNFQD